MNFLKRILGLGPARLPDDPPPLEPKPAAPIDQEIDTVNLQGNGEYALEVVGESFYQDNLEHICGPRTTKSVNKLTQARLVLDDGNPHDSKAVRVEIDGLQVGHLSREIARWYRGVLKENGHKRPVGIVGAKIKGGWKRDDDEGHYGVWLDIPMD